MPGIVPLNPRGRIDLQPVWRFPPFARTFFESLTLSLTMSIAFDGKEYSSRAQMPDQVRRAYDATYGARDVGASSDITAAFLLAFVAGFVIVSAIALMYTLGGGPRHLGGRLMIAVAGVVLLGWIDSMATRLMRRREAVI